MPFTQGDSFTLTITGGKPNAPVTVAENGGAPVNVGTTDGSGMYSVSGTWVAANLGTHAQVWYTGGVPANAISFVVYPPPTPNQSGSGSQQSTTCPTGQVLRLQAGGGPGTCVPAAQQCATGYAWKADTTMLAGGSCVASGGASGGSTPPPPQSLSTGMMLGIAGAGVALLLLLRG